MWPRLKRSTPRSLPAPSARHAAFSARPVRHPDLHQGEAPSLADSGPQGWHLGPLHVFGPRSSRAGCR
eukprot:11922337-Alexandrium_andersonii.AAC.1